MVRIDLNKKLENPPVFRNQIAINLCWIMFYIILFIYPKQTLA